MLPIHHIALRVQDCGRSLAFYGGVLGLPELRRSTEGKETHAVWLRAGDSILMLERSLRGEGQGLGSGHLLAFVISDLHLWEDRLREAGIRVEDRTPQTLYFRDPDGHRVGLSVYPLPFLL